jgi:peptide deformylase
MEVLKKIDAEIETLNHQITLLEKTRQETIGIAAAEIKQAHQVLYILLPPGGGPALKVCFLTKTAATDYFNQNFNYGHCFVRAEATENMNDETLINLKIC